MPKRIYPPELHTFVAEHASGTNDRDLTELINARFGNGYITEPQVKAYRSNHHLPSGLPKGRATYFPRNFRSQLCGTSWPIISASVRLRWRIS